jgi:hypothetical protein
MSPHTAPTAAVRPGRRHLPGWAQAPRVPVCAARTAGILGVGHALPACAVRTTGAPSTPFSMQVTPCSASGISPTTTPKPTTAMVGKWHGDGLDIENRAAASSTRTSRSAEPLGWRPPWSASGTHLDLPVRHGRWGRRGRWSLSVIASRTAAMSKPSTVKVGECTPTTGGVRPQHGTNGNIGRNDGHPARNIMVSARLTLQNAFGLPPERY